MDKQLLIERVSLLCKEKDISMTTAFIESKVGKDFKSNMKYANPSLGKITMLANYFGVSVDYLLGNTDSKETPVASDEDMEEVVIYHRDGKTVRKKFTKSEYETIIKMLDALGDSNPDL